MAASTPHGAQLRLVSATPATQPATLPATTPDVGERELIIDVRRDDWVQYEGTAAQLIAEGLIPADFEWPRAAADKRWEANGFDYWLRRTRPEGLKGPMRTWLEMDNWFIRVEVTGRDYHWRTRQALKRQAEELAAAYHRHTAAGSAEWNANWKRYWATVEDKKFQAFKSTFLPERKKPGRKPKAQASEGAQQ